MSMRKIMPLAGLLVSLGCTHQEAPHRQRLRSRRSAK